MIFRRSKVLMPLLTLKMMIVPSAKISLILQRTKSARTMSKPNKLKLNNRVLSIRKSSRWQQLRTVIISVSLMRATRKKWMKNKRAKLSRNNLKHSTRQTPSSVKSLVAKMLVL
jgi:hypothetical protein